MENTVPTHATVHRPADATTIDMATLFGEWAAQARHPRVDSERLALAIRVVEALQQDLRAARRAP